jgi:hypothetical protein
MACWLFYVMDFLDRGDGWKKQVGCGVAAQHYPRGWVGEGRNLSLLRRIKRGDWLVAGRAFRFAGYAKATSDFARRGQSLRIRRGDGRVFAFRERVNVKWYVVPGYENFENWLDLRELDSELLKRSDSQWSAIRFNRLCIKEVSADIFRELKRRLDEVDAGRVGVGQAGPVKSEAKTLPTTSWDDLLDEEPSPARQSTFTVTRPVRDPRNRMAAQGTREMELRGTRVPDSKVQTERYGKDVR